MGKYCCEIPFILMALLFPREICRFYIFTFTFKTKQVFVGNVKEMFRIDKSFITPVLRRIAPTVTNEAFFGIGQSLYTKAFGYLGAASITAVAIADKISSLLFMVVWAVVSSVQAIVGAKLGEGDYDAAEKYSYWFMGLGLVLSATLGVIMATASTMLVH